MSIEIVLFFLFMIEINLISVWGMELDLISVQGRNWFGCCVDGRNSSDFSAGIGIDLVFVWRSKTTCFLMSGWNLARLCVGASKST